MTGEEADYEDEYYTKNPPEIDPAANGGFVGRSFKMIAIDCLLEHYLLTRAMAAHKTPAEIISGLVRKEIAGTPEPAILGKQQATAALQPACLPLTNSAAIFVFSYAFNYTLV
jgi:hypothetical protein